MKTPNDAITLEYESALNAWRQSLEDALRQPDGWLSLIGLHWLQEGENSVGSASDAVVRIDAEGIPDRLGVITLAAGVLTLRVTDGMPVTINDERITEAVLYPGTETEDPTFVRAGSVTFFILEREAGYAVRVSDSRSPAIAAFEGRAWYPPDPAWRFSVPFSPLKQRQIVQVETSAGFMMSMESLGCVEFEHHGQAHRLIAFDSGAPSSLWFIFNDQTNGRETYGAGRFLKVALDDGGCVDLDFNRAYHPPCAFTDFATCPLAPPENRLPFSITAGERNRR